MRMYERYVDDSNQIAEVPPPNTRCDVQTGKLVPEHQIANETDEQRTGRILKEVANSVQNGIEMEEDLPSRNPDGKLPILKVRRLHLLSPHSLTFSFQHWRLLFLSERRNV